MYVNNRYIGEVSDYLPDVHNDDRIRIRTVRHNEFILKEIAGYWIGQDYSGNTMRVVPFQGMYVNGIFYGSVSFVQPLGFYDSNLRPFPF